MYINDLNEMSKLTNFIFNLYGDKYLSKIFNNFWKNYPYKNAWFIIVSPGRIQARHYEMLKK